MPQIQKWSMWSGLSFRRAQLNIWYAEKDSEGKITTIEKKIRRAYFIYYHHSHGEIGTAVRRQIIHCASQ